MTTDDGGRRPVALDPVVEEALRLGPFERALRVAIATSELSLERIEVHLRDRGFPIGRSTLSYWQKGLRRPERPESMNALRALEDLLGINQGGLSALLGPRKPRGRWIGYRGAGLEWSEMWGPGEEIRKVLAQDLRRNNDKLLDISLSESLVIGADRRMQSVEINQVSQARENGADRAMILTGVDRDHEITRVSLSNTANCRVGRQRAVGGGTNVAAFELLFDRALPEAGTHMFRYRIDFAPGFLSAREMAERNVDLVPSTEGGRAFRRQAHTYLLSAQFDLGMLPIRCYHVRANHVGGHEQVISELTVNAFGAAHIVLQNVQPGMHSIRWEWE